MKNWMEHITAMEEDARKTYLKEISKVEICSGVTSIADEAFMYCTHLNEVIIPSGVTSIGASAVATHFS